MYQDFKKLELYKTADKLVLLVYKVTKNYPKEELFGIVNQMRRAAVSVVANFVEGYALLSSLQTQAAKLFSGYLRGLKRNKLI